jgi:tRNA (adenine37-N6)-methyltransferase
MHTTTQIRPGEATVETPASFDAGVWFIGAIRTPWKDRRECPRRGDLDGPVCRIDVAEPWRGALAGLARHTHLQVLYWMHEARRDLVTQTPNHTGAVSGTFSIRSPNRPNPIASSLVAIVAVHEDGVSVRGLDCLDGTPLIDLKPETCPHDAARPAAAD